MFERCCGYGWPAKAPGRGDNWSASTPVPSGRKNRSVRALALANKLHPGGLLVLDAGGQVARWARTAHGARLTVERQWAVLDENGPGAQE